MKDIHDLMKRLEDTQEGETICLNHNEAKLILKNNELLKEQQEEIKRLKYEKARAIESIESEINRLHKESRCVKDEVSTAIYEWLINAYQSSLDMIKDGDRE